MQSNLEVNFKIKLYSSKCDLKRIQVLTQNWRCTYCS